MEKSIQEKLDELTEKMDKLYPKDKRLVSELTVEELKSIIRQIVREEVNYKSMPVQPFYYQPVQPWYNTYEVTCDTKTSEKKNSPITSTKTFPNEINSALEGVDLNG